MRKCCTRQDAHVPRCAGCAGHTQQLPGAVRVIEAAGLVARAAGLAALVIAVAKHTT